jgi:hypothetical protein
MASGAPTSTMVPTTSNVSTTLCDKTVIASFGETLPIMNCEIAAQVPDGQAVNIHANGIVIEGVRILQSQESLNELVSTALRTTPADMFQRILIRRLTHYLSFVVARAFKQVRQSVSAHMGLPIPGIWKLQHKTGVSIA